MRAKPGSAAFDFGGPAAEAQHRGEVVHELVAIEGAGEHPKFDDAVGEELAEVDHATAAAVGSVGFPGGVGRCFHLFDQVPDIVAKSAAVLVQVASSARLPVEAHGVPPCDVGELAGKFAHCLRVVGADDGGHAHRDMAAAGGVDVRPDGVGPFDELQQVLNTRSPVENGGNKLAGHAAKIAANGTVAVGPPVVAIEGGSGERLVGGRVVAAAHGGAAVVAADGHAGRGGDGGFELDSEGDLLGLGILGSHGIVDAGGLRVPTSSFLPHHPVVCRAPSARQLAPYFRAILRAARPLAYGLYCPWKQCEDGVLSWQTGLPRNQP